VPTQGTMNNYVQIAPNNVKMKTGGLVAIHGWSHAKHAAAKHLELSVSQSVLHGHTHRHQVFTVRDPWSNKIVKSFCPGTLSQLQPIYAHGGSPTSWVHGFTLVYVGEHSWTEYNVTISNGACVLPDGRELKI
jgi:predicted phosphodiesterase